MTVTAGGHHADQSDVGRLACNAEVLGVLFRREGE